MKPFIREQGLAAPLEGRNIDTDQIVPSRFLKQERNKGYGQLLFHDMRFDDQGCERPGFVLNRPEFRETQILVTDRNFGCGSSREGAVYALSDYGIRAIIAPSFGDIFHNNCLKNGIVPVKLSEQDCDALRQMLAQNPGMRITVDLESLHVVLANGSNFSFDIDGFWRECLLKGVDDLELTLSILDQIEQFEKEYFSEAPWANPKAGEETAPSP